jgi:hypothetical protein
VLARRGQHARHRVVAEQPQRRVCVPIGGAIGGCDDRSAAAGDQCRRGGRGGDDGAPMLCAVSRRAVERRRAAHVAPRRHQRVGRVAANPLRGVGDERATPSHAQRDAVDEHCNSAVVRCRSCRISDAIRPHTPGDERTRQSACAALTGAERAALQRRRWRRRR